MRGKRSLVLPLAIVLVLGQIAAFVAIKLSKDHPAPAKGPAVAATEPGADPAAGPTPDPGTPTPPVVVLDAARAMKGGRSGD